MAAIATVWLTMLVLGLEVQDQQTRLAAVALGAESKKLSTADKTADTSSPSGADTAPGVAAINTAALVQQDLGAALVESIHGSASRRRVVMTAIERRSDSVSATSAGGVMPTTAADVDLQFTLRGSYTDIKATLADTLAREHGSAIANKVQIRRLEIRRTADSADVEAVAQIAIVSAAANAGPSEQGATMASSQRALTGARFDPFNGLPANPPPLPAPVQSVALPPAAAIAPLAPALNYRFFGRMTTPQGQVITLLARADHVVVVEPGQQLDEGFVVQSVDLDAVRLHHPPSDVHVTIALPPPTVEPLAVKPSVKP